MALFPAVMIGGPPHSGKSVLAYSLTQALRQKGIAHYVLRAYPDGEGDWANEADQQLVRQIRVKGQGTPQWIDFICRDIANRHLPLIVDVGGRPTAWQEAVFNHCTHAILLTPDPAARQEWQAFISKYGLQLVADLHSSLTGDDLIESESPCLSGQVSGLERGHTAQGRMVQALVDRLTTLFDYDEAELRQAHMATAPTELVVELNRVGQTFGSSSERWHYWLPTHLPALLDYLPANTPLALYDRGPNWLYAAIAQHLCPAELYQFDSRLGWVASPRLTASSTTNSTLVAHLAEFDTHRQLEFELSAPYLDYAEAESLTVPVLPRTSGLIISGKLPLWLWTALVRVYHDLPWLAVFQPQLEQQGVVIASRDKRNPIGSLVRWVAPK